MSETVVRHRWLVAAGIFPLPWFLAWVSVGGLLAPGYNSLAQHASELSVAKGAPAICLTIAALGAGVAFVIFAAGLWMEAKRLLAFGAVATALFGASMASNGLWPMGHPLHGLYGLGLINLIAPALVLIETRRLHGDPVVYAITVLASFAGVFYLWLNLTGNDVPEFRGLSQRVFSSIYSAWAAVAALRLLRQRPYGER